MGVRVIVTDVSASLFSAVGVEKGHGIALHLAASTREKPFRKSYLSIQCLREVGFCPFSGILCSAGAFA